MCKMKAERIIKETLMKTHCRFLTSELEDGLLRVWFLDVKGNCQKAIFPYRYMNEQDVVDRVMEVIF